MEEREKEGVVRELEETVKELKEIGASLKEGGAPREEIRARVEHLRESIDALRGGVAAGATDDAILTRVGDKSFIQWKRDRVVRWAEEKKKKTEIG